LFGRNNNLKIKIVKKSGREIFEKFKVLIWILVKLFSIFSKNINQILFKLFRNTNGKFGILFRYIILKNISKEIGKNVSIHPGVFLFGFDKLIIGDNVSIHPMCYIDATGGISIGDNVSIAHSCSILSTDHTWKDSSIPIKYNSITKGFVKINEDVWIGCGCRILSGVKISKRSIIAAGSVVTKNIESNTVNAGVPSKVIKNIAKND
jgi:acetyltransferase-like isoleucine patch superfamily enzyme